MKHFDYSAQFKKESKRLIKKYKSLPEDLRRLETFLDQYPSGIGASFAVLSRQPSVCIVKARLACESLRSKSLRVIYVYKESEKRIEFIEIYFKGDKSREDELRIKEYLNNLDTLN